MNGNDLVPHLFRNEYSKLVSVLTRTLGLENLEIAEDLASETFALALETWPYKGTPPNPAAWLYQVAKNKTSNYFKRQNIFQKIGKEISLSGADDIVAMDFSENHISDSQLQMLFVLCHPAISTESQICLALRILCGFGLDEIASAFLTSKETIHKRLQRAREKLRAEGIIMEMPEADQISGRLDTILHTIYLLFSEGYYSESKNDIVRKELCVEALNLVYLLLKNPLTNTHSSNALMSLMCFHASRLEARQAGDGSIILYDEQDRSLWDTQLIEKGFYYLQQASQWEITSRYYVEASIAYWHTVDNNNPEKWPGILRLYDVLLILDNSPVIALNRLVAFSRVFGNQAAITEAEKLDFDQNHFYFVLLAHLYRDINTRKSIFFYEKAMRLCKTERERKMIEKCIEHRP